MANRYWVGGTASWNSAAGTKWATTSGGPGGASVPTSADDVFFDSASTGTCSIASGNTGAKSINCTGFSGTLTGVVNITVSGSVTLSAGMTFTHSGVFVLNGTGTLTSNGKTFSSIAVDGPGITVTLADNLALSTTLTLQSGSFDAVSYNVTTATFAVSLLGSSARVLKMGTGLWTLTGGGLVSSVVWNVDVSSGASFNLIQGSANIVLSDTSSSFRVFRGGGFSYNKLTIGGATGTSTLSITGNNQFTELASTKTVAHTIDFDSTTQTFGRWTVTGTLGNVVTLAGTGTSHILAGACTSGIDYLAMGSIGFAATSPGEFYAGANSTGTAAAPVYRTAKPADSARYWVGGTGNWSDTNRWSTSSGGAGGASVPRSHDDVVFDSASNATAYTATVNAVTGGIRMKSLTIAGPLVGNVTLAGSTAMAGIHSNVSLPATGLTLTYTGNITLSSNSTGLTFASNGVTLASTITVNGVDCGWSLGSNLDIGASKSFSIVNGSFDFAGYNYTGADITSTSNNKRTITLGAGTISVASTFPFSLGTTESSRASLTFAAGTSQINASSSNAINFFGNDKTFYNVSFTSTSNTSISISGANTYNNLTFAGLASVGVKFISFGSGQTVSGTLTLSANAGGNSRTFFASPTIGSALTLTCNAVSALQDIDFRDIVIAGAAVSGGPISGTRLGDCGGNGGLVFDAAKTVYYVNATSGNWSDGWSFTSGGSASTGAFPLAQDMAIIEAAYPTSGSTISMNHSYSIGTINMSGRTSSLLTLNLAGFSNGVYGDWTNGSGVTITGASFSFQGPVFLGRSTQTITSAGKVFPGKIQVDCVGGSVVLADNMFLSGEFRIYGVNCTFNANNKNVTVVNSVDINSTSPGTINIGDEVWTVGDAWLMYTPFTITGSGTIKMTKGTAKSFVGGGATYGNVVLEQAGNGQLTITGNNTFRSVASSVSVANTINMSGTTQTITGQWTAKGSAGNLLTISGGSLVGLPTGVSANIDYVNVSSNSASPANSWYAGANSVNSGSSGWIFTAAPVSAGFFMLL